MPRWLVAVPLSCCASLLSVLFKRSGAKFLCGLFDSTCFQFLYSLALSLALGNLKFRLCKDFVIFWNLYQLGYQKFHVKNVFFSRNFRLWPPLYLNTICLKLRHGLNLFDWIFLSHPGWFVEIFSRGNNFDSDLAHLLCKIPSLKLTFRPLHRWKEKQRGFSRDKSRLFCLWIIVLVGVERLLLQSAILKLAANGRIMFDVRNFLQKIAIASTVFIQFKYWSSLRGSFVVQVLLLYKSLCIDSQFFWSELRLIQHIKKVSDLVCCVINLLFSKSIFIFAFKWETFFLF